MSRFSPAAAAMLLAAIAPVAAPAADTAFLSCLRMPARAADLVADCTVVIESQKASPAERIAALNNRGAELGFHGTDLAEARADLDRAIALQPALARLYVTRAGLRAAAGDNAGAIADLGEAIRLDPQFAIAWGNRGAALLAEKRFAEAMRDLDQAIRLAPGYAHPLYDPYETRAQVKDASGDAAGAAVDRAAAGKAMASGKTATLASAVSGRRVWEPWLVP